MGINIVIILVGIAAALALFSKKMQTSKDWQATVTPLASIIGSGFLISVPLLATEVGNWAIVAIAVLVGAAYLIGSVIRFNIKHAEPLMAEADKTKKLSAPVSLEKLSHFVLAFAYFISVAYYLVLLGNFLLSGFDITSKNGANVIATIVLAGLGLVGFTKGLALVEKVEKYAVGLNLAVIAALLGGLIWYNGTAFAGGTWQFAKLENTFDLKTVQVLLGLLIVVQGFETSRFMGGEFDADTRIRTMRYAQWISTAIYIVFFGTVTVLFKFLGDDTGISAIIGLVGHVAMILPVILTIGAVASQFSASVADSVGGGGLMVDISGHKLSLKHAYPLIAIVAIAVTWNTDVFSIITLASQAFALFYFVQCCVAFSIVYENKDLGNRQRRMAFFAFVAVLCFCVTIFGIPSGG